MKALTEQQVLRKLGIQDFRHLSKKKIMKFFSMIPNMDPEVAKAALAQFPAYANSVNELVKDYKEIVLKMIESDKEDSLSYHTICNEILKNIEDELHKDNLTFEEKDHLINKMLDLQENIRKYHKDRRDHAFKIIGTAGIFIGGIIVAITSAIGGASSTELPDDLDC